MPAPPVFTPGSKVLVEMRLGGISGSMELLEPSSKPMKDVSAKRLSELGTPCWEGAP